MESLPPPSKIARLSDPGFGLGPTSGWNMERNRCNEESRSSPPIGLGLELGRGNNGGGARQFNGCNKSQGFTFLQYQELQLQSVIYKYIEAGFAVPYNLVLPIWNSVIASLGGLTPTLYQLYPTFMGGSSPMYLEYKNGIDPEPGRCRRTDGKKWRCSKEALADHKYCERHMHRGRHRSRKLVEATHNASSLPPSPATSTNLSISLPITSTTASSTSHFSLSNCGFSPKSVLLGDVQRS